MVDTELPCELARDIAGLLDFQDGHLNPPQEALLHLVRSVEMAMGERGSDRTYLASHLSSRLFTLACNSAEIGDLSHDSAEVGESVRKRVFALSFELDKVR
jgi:hypothetical protein